MSEQRVSINRALISVSDKTGVVELAQSLHNKGVDILSTGGTATLLREAGVAVTEVADHTGFPEMMAGRVKTLHPKIHGGLLGRRGIDDDVMKEHDIGGIDLLVVNLYPFQETIARADCTQEMGIENIDIGGPAMLRSAAKNHASVAVVTDPSDYSMIVDEVNSAGGLTFAQRFKLAAKTFAQTAIYDSAIATWLAAQVEASTGETAAFPDRLSLNFEKAYDLRYGENPHQSAAFYREQSSLEPSVASAKTLQGKALSFNNLADADSALECVKQFDVPSCVIVKHANPCGVATSTDALAAYELAYRTDPTSAFGGIIAFNVELDAQTAKVIIERQFVEVIIAPKIGTDALAILASKPNVRVLETGYWGALTVANDYKRVAGGLLVQDRDLGQISLNDLRCVTEVQPDDQQLRDLLFAWQVAKFVKSNAIVYAKDSSTIGVGAGQMSRVYSAKIAGIKAEDEKLVVTGSVMASDAFFPFRDGIDSAAKAGVTAVIQPGGSMRDDDVIQAANEHGLAMVFTGMRHFRH